MVVSFLVVWGWACAVLGTLAAIPQLVRLSRVGSSAGLALPLWQLNFGAGIGWTVHGITTGHMNVILPNFLITLTNIAVLVLVQRDRGLQARAVWPLGLMVAALGVAVELGLPNGWFGALVLIPHSIGALAQTRDLVREPDLSGVSAQFLVNAAGVQAIWLVWAVLTPDWSVIWASGVLIVITTANVVIYFTRRRSGRIAVPDVVGADAILARTPHNLDVGPAATGTPTPGVDAILHARAPLDAIAGLAATGVQGADPAVPVPGTHGVLLDAPEPAPVAVS